MSFSLSELSLPVRLRPPMPMSDEELLSFCAANDDLRIERDKNGELIVMTPAGGETGDKNSEIIADLKIWTRLDGRGKSFDSSTGFSLPDGSMRSPDAAWISLSRWNLLSKKDRRGFVPLAPDFVIELRSPSDSLTQLKEKMEQWIANGTELAWLIDPSEQAVYIYRLGQSPEIHSHPTSIQGVGIIAGFELVMARIWD